MGAIASSEDRNDHLPGGNRSDSFMFDTVKVFGSFVKMQKDKARWRDGPRLAARADAVTFRAPPRRGKSMASPPAIDV